MDGHAEEAAAALGGNVNQHGGFYFQGQAYGHSKKLQVAVEYKIAKREAEQLRKVVNLSAVARKCCVGYHFVAKIRDELLFYGRVLKPSEIMDNRNIDRGPGARTLDEFDRFVLLQLLDENPTRTLRSYAEGLEEYTGKKVSQSVICRWFLEAFPVTGGMVKPNLVPYDKFKPSNESRAYEYLYMLSHLAPHRIKFGDKKSLKGQELFLRLVRKNPSTGEVAPIMTTSDFRNTHSITGFCGIDERSVPVWHKIRKETNDAEQFKRDVEEAISTGFLLSGDVVVLDNATIHTGGENYILVEWLWEYFGIFVLFLPTRTPEWNPIELVWNTLVQRLKRVDLRQLRQQYGTDCAAHASVDILNEMTHEEIAKFYRSCYMGFLF